MQGDLSSRQCATSVLLRGRSGVCTDAWRVHGRRHGLHTQQAAQRQCLPGGCGRYQAPGTRHLGPVPVLLTACSREPTVSPAVSPASRGHKRPTLAAVDACAHRTQPTCIVNWVAAHLLQPCIAIQLGCRTVLPLTQVWFCRDRRGQAKGRRGRGQKGPQGGRHEEAAKTATNGAEEAAEDQGDDHEEE